MASSFEQFAVEQTPGLLRMATVLTADPGVAEEVVQEVLVRVSRRWTSMQDLASPEAYVRRMVVNEYRSWRRKWARFVAVPTILEDERLTGADHADQLADRDDLAQRLARLPTRQRAVLVLRYYEGLSDTEIAEILGCSISTVRSHSSRALASLRIDASSEAPPAAPNRVAPATALCKEI